MFLTCETTPMTNPLQQLNLPVYLFVKNKRVSRCAVGAVCSFSYREDVTPNLFWTSPISASPQQYVRWYGIYRSANTADIKKMHIGDQLCHRFEQDGATVLNDDQPIDPNALVLVTCKVADDQEGGLYNLTLRSTAGNPR